MPLAALVLVGLLAAACSSATAPAGQTATATPGLSETFPLASATSRASETSVPSSATPVPNSAATPTRAAATSVTPLPSPSATPHGPAYDWLQFNGDAQHSGNNTKEQTLTANNVSHLQRAFRVELPSVADGAPVSLHAVNTAHGLADLLFVTTKAGDILALDAHSGAIVWEHQVPAGSCRINNFVPACYTTSSPAIDPGRQYVYSYGLDGRVHKYRAADGLETIDGTWPEVVTLKPYDEKGSSALAITTARNGQSYLYVVISGYFGDQGDYQGHLVAINLANGSQRVFNALCSDQNAHLGDSRAGSGTDCSETRAGIWARAGVVYDQNTDRIYAATGNGTFDPAHHHWGDTVFALHPDGTGANGDPLDSYTPASFAQLQLFDADLGSTAPALLPPLAGSAIQHLAVQGGKDEILRLINLDDLSGQGGVGHTGGEVFSLPVPMGGQILTAPAVWTDPTDSSLWVFVANGSGIAGLQLTLDGSTGQPSLRLVWQKPAGGTSPILANGVLYNAGSSHLQALDPETGSTLWNTTQIGPIHWESPLVADGTVYVTDDSGELTAFSLPR